MHNLQQPGMGMSPMLQPQQQQQPSPQQHLQQQQQLQQQQLMQGVIGPQQVPTMVHPQQQQPPQQPEKNDNISKVKTLVAPLRESLLVIEDIRNVFGSKCVFFCFVPQNTLKISAQLLQNNNFADNGSMKGIDSNSPPPRFDKHLEEFYSICDQIELHLVSAKRELSELNCIVIVLYFFVRKLLFSACSRIHPLNVTCLCLCKPHA